jgi:alpha-tubulin suppressor-like RCC1 family protein
VLAVALDGKLFSWGDGSYGALGFGDREHKTGPARLEIYDHKGRVYKIVQAVCGKQHSMCLTDDANIYSWGKSAHGRLGHEDEPTDLLRPKEIYTLSQRKPIFIACGESHSAAISEKHQLFTWGHGGYGRLGHGTADKAAAPTVVEALKSVKVLAVSCGFNHTLAISENSKGERQTWAFGQNKYGKLGVHYQKADGKIPTYADPVAISTYHIVEETPECDEVEPERMDVAEVCAGYNHSLALTKKGKPYSWGYHGRAVLGRPCVGRTPLVALAVTVNQDFKLKKEPGQKDEDQIDRFRPRAQKNDTVDEKDGAG